MGYAPARSAAFSVGDTFSREDTSWLIMYHKSKKHSVWYRRNHTETCTSMQIIITFTQRITHSCKYTHMRAHESTLYFPRHTFTLACVDSLTRQLAFVNSFHINFLWRLLLRSPFHRRVTGVARKRSRPFCQRCRWQATVKHVCTFCTTRRDGSSFTWHQPCNNQTALFGGYPKTRYNKL